MRIKNKELILILSPFFIFVGNMYANADYGKTDANKARVTADDQSTTSYRDTELTRQVRERIVQDGGLSTAAKNITIVTVGGKITLSGMVASQAEKEKVESIAKTVTGASSVTNQTVISR
ncbi:periplasmic protein [compost metagenome]